MQVLPVRETMSRGERNKRLSKTKKGGDESQLVPEGFDPYHRVYICTHGWKKRKSRGTGSRPRQHIRLTDCPFRFVVQWNVARGELQVKNGFFVHNHKLSPSSYATYPSSRGVDNRLVAARVEGMLAVGAKRSKIYDYLLEHDQNVIQVDVDNMVRVHASSVATVDDNDATARELAVFAAADLENVSAVAETAGGETGVISLASAHMRRIYSRFSELLLVDCSHKTNRYNYQLLTIMTMNEFGEGAVVQQSLLEANGDWHMERAVAHFKRLHPTRIDRLRVIVVDKDLNEIK
uniref:ZSWIM1/3 RNaseH-like domain-containing protein n=1 Tax=Phytophthora ramorum TaxID=164328 RepID=H3H4E9_PHYRM